MENVQEFESYNTGRADDRDLVAFLHRQPHSISLSREEKRTAQHPHLCREATPSFEAGPCHHSHLSGFHLEVWLGLGGGEYEDAARPVSYRRKDRDRPAN